MIKQRKFRHGKSVVARCCRERSPTDGRSGFIDRSSTSTHHTLTARSQPTRPARPSVYRNTQHRTFRLWQLSLMNKISAGIERRAVHLRQLILTCNLRKDLTTHTCLLELTKGTYQPVDSSSKIFINCSHVYLL